MKPESIKPAGPKKLSLKEQKLSLMRAIESANDNIVLFKSQGNKQAWESWTKVKAAFERKLQELKDGKYGED